MRASRLALALATVLPAAASPATAQTPETSAVYRCDGGEWFTVIFSGDTASLTDSRGRTYSLKQAETGSGIRYERADNILRGEGRYATWSVQGRDPLNCQVSRNPEESLPGYKPAQTDLVHEATGIHFPLKVGTASRLGGTPQDITDDVAMVRYSVPIHDGGHAIVSIGIVHLEGLSALQHYVVFRAEMLRQMAGGKVRREGAIEIAGSQDAYRGSFVGREEAGGLITVNFGYWSARLESRYPLAQADEAQDAILAFVNGLDWTQLRNAPASDTTP